MKKLLVVLYVALSSVAHAQVIKCKDPKTGHVTYSDSGCAASNTATQVQNRRSADDVAADNERAVEARNRLQREASPMMVRDVVDAPRVEAAGVPRNFSASYECEMARKTQSMGGKISRDAVDQACYGPEVAAQIKLERAKKAIAPTTPQQMNCRPDHIGGFQCR